MLQRLFLQPQQLRCTVLISHVHRCSTVTSSSLFQRFTHPHSASCSHSTSAAGSSSTTSTPSSSNSDTFVRTRYAPSPTGSMHLGGLRTALYNYLYARQHQMLHPTTAAATTSTTDSTSSSPPTSFLLRIEDTDQKRLVPEAVPNLLTAMKWAGLEHDEGPGVKDERRNQCGPYVQSERLPIYHHHIQTLLSNGSAYPCFCTAERLAALRTSQASKGLPSQYDRLCEKMSAAEREEKMADAKKNGTSYVIRMKIPSSPSNTTIHDLIRGSVSFPNKTIDDQILLKSDGFPTYHFACIVDDHEMKVTHVVRGEEWLTSTPKHVILYKMFGWSIPQFAHLPLLLKPDGSKLSKRHDDASVEYYIQRGYLPEAVVNFVAFLGWNPGKDTTKEVYTMKELIQEFSFERIQKAGAVVNLEKLNWFNQQHIQRLAKEDVKRLMELVRPIMNEFWKGRFESADATTPPSDMYDDTYLLRIIYALSSHVTHLSDFAKDSVFYCEIPNYQSVDLSMRELRKKVWGEKNELVEVNQRLIASTIEKLNALPEEAWIVEGPQQSSSPTAATSPSTPSTTSSSTSLLQSLFKSIVKEHNVKQKQYFTLLRYILTGSESGPAASTLIVTLGKERVVGRLKNESTYVPKL